MQYLRACNGIIGTVDTIPTIFQRVLDGMDCPYFSKYNDNPTTDNFEDHRKPT